MGLPKKSTQFTLAVIEKSLEDSEQAHRVLLKLQAYLPTRALPSISNSMLLIVGKTMISLWILMEKKYTDNSSPC
jgi:hypothetical protein